MLTIWLSYIGLIITWGITRQFVIAQPDNYPRGRPIYRYKRIIGGYPIKAGTYPWAVSIQAVRHPGIHGLFRRNREHYCGAALIEPDWVVTAAHCLYNEDENERLISYLNPKMWHIRMASEKLRPNMAERVKGWFRRVYNFVLGDVKPQPFYHVKKIFHHPKYNPGHLEYDIALMQLKETPILQKLNNLDLIDLPDPISERDWPAAGQTCIAVGWGCSFADGPPTMIGRSVHLPVLAPSVCRKMYASYINLTSPHEFCAGFFNENKGICPGDSGGPLVCKASTGELKLAGIVSATHSHHPADFPAIFTRVSYFSEWIRSVIKRNPSKFRHGWFSLLHEPK